MLPKYISGVSVFEEWVLTLSTKPMKVWIFGESHNSSEGCTSRTNDCIDFMTFLERAIHAHIKTNLFIELSYIRPRPIFAKNRARLANIPALFKDGNISKVKDKYLDCIFTFEAHKCAVPVKSLQFHPSDLRAEKLVDNKRGTSEYSVFSKPLFKPEAVLDLCMLVSNHQVLLYHFIISTNSQSSAIASVYATLKAKKVLNDFKLKQMISLMFTYYDNKKGHEVDITNKEIVSKLKTTCPTSINTVYLLAYLCSYGTIITDLYIILQCLNSAVLLEDSIILTGSYHSGIYSLLLAFSGAKRTAVGKVSGGNKMCLKLGQN